jgi:enoyl-CoA hydratase/carnithine racemase
MLVLRDEDRCTWRLTMAPSSGDDVTLTREGLEQLDEQLQAAERASECRVVVLQSSGASFCLGMDLQGAVGSDPGAGPRCYADVLRRLSSSSKLTIAAVDGATVGGGVGLAAASDMVVATQRSKFGLPEITIGLLPAMVMPVLQERLSPQKLRRLALLAASIDARQARELGLVDDLVDDADALRKRVSQLVRTARRAGPGTIAAVKNWAARLRTMSRNEGIAVGCELTEAHLRTPYVQERLAESTGEA